MFDLTNKTALITGASGGIGREIALALHKAGAKVAISGTRQNALDETSAAANNELMSIPCNLSKPEEVDGLIKQAEEKLGQLDILVCNAGITRDGLLMRMKDDDWQDVLDVNLTASFKLIRAASRGMMKRRSGRIINITSIVGVMGNPGQANYCASKAGLIGMSKSIGQELAGRGITVNCIAPGFIKTAMTDALNEDQQERITKNIPAGRFGLPEDIAAATVFLASDSASYITGQTLHVNGGLLMV
ncbi:MAG: 3-oxoacyl-[acyl-carrier-protein] reductase [Alphaproteobacteria bacterium]|nr:3-oxoacyl-[acyl-carrier-protein] reductase [Alphaproteobacteria bacterium]